MYEKRISCLQKQKDAEILFCHPAWREQVFRVFENS